MSRIYVDRISPYQSGSVQVDGLSLDTGSLTTLAEFNAYTASTANTIATLATTGSNTFSGNQTFNIGGGALTFKIVGPNNQFFSYDDNSTWGVTNNAFSAGTTFGPGPGFNFYDGSADAGLHYNLNNATSQGDSRPGLYSYSGSVAQDVIAFPNKSWGNNGQVEFKTSVKANQGIVISGSIDNNNSGGTNLFTQNTAKFTVANGNKKFHVEGGSYELYTANDSWAVSNLPFTQGLLMGNTYGFNLYNSAFTKDHGFALNMNTAAGTGTNKIGFWGRGSGGYYDFISFEDATNWTDGRIEVHRTLQVDEVLQLQAQDPLPSGQLGQLAVSGSDLYFHNGTSWVVK